MDAACFQPGGFHRRNKRPSFGWHFNEWAEEGLWGSDDGRPHINTGTSAQRDTTHWHKGLLCTRMHTRDTSTWVPFICALWRSFWESYQNLPICMFTHAGTSRSIHIKTDGVRIGGCGQSTHATSPRTCVRFPMWLNPWEHHLHLSFFCSCGSFSPSPSGVCVLLLMRQSYTLPALYSLRDNLIKSGIKNAFIYLCAHGCSR